MKKLNNLATKVAISVGPAAYGVFYVISEFIMHALKIPHGHG